MKWNVYRYDFNLDEIYIFNIFEHGSFKKEVNKVLRNIDSKEEFEEKLRMEAMYYFWSKAEHEILIYPLFGRFRDKGKDARKIDIYNQLNLNWNKFVDYVWSFKNKKGEKENE